MLNQSNYSGNGESDTSGSSNGHGGDEKSRKKHQLQTDIVMKESDLKRYNRTKESLEMEVRKLKREQERLTIGLQQKIGELNKLNFEISQSEAEIKKLKKDLSALF